MFTAKLNYNGVILMMEAETEKKLIQKLAFWQSLPDECPKCGAKLVFNHRIAKNEQGKDCHYYELLCKGKVWHKAALREHAEGETLYYKFDEPFLTFEDIQAKSDSRKNGSQMPAESPETTEEKPKSELTIAQAELVNARIKFELSDEQYNHWYRQFTEATTVGHLRKLLVDMRTDCKKEKAA